MSMSTRTGNGTKRFVLQEGLEGIQALNDVWSYHRPHCVLKRCYIDTRALDVLLPTSRPVPPARTATPLDIPHPTILQDSETAMPAASSEIHPDRLDLDFLRELQHLEGGYSEPRDSFFPLGSILIRDCMRHIFQRFHLSNGQGGKVVFIGSQGVGKSVLFFLAALFKARTKTVVFLRYTKASNYISVFLMHSCERNNELIDVVFTRSAQKMSVQKRVTSFVDELTNLVLGTDDIKDFLSFVNGPNYNDDTDLRLCDCYNFYCPSDGFPGFKDCQRHDQLWILDAWSKEDAVQALKLHASNYSKDTATKAYDLCGGNIRLMLGVCKDERTFSSVRADLEYLTSGVAPVTLGCQWTEHGDKLSAKLNLYDRLVSMFGLSHSDDAKRMRPIQLVDSHFVLHRVVPRANLAALKYAYDLSLELEDKTIQEMFYEKLIHQWFQSTAANQEMFYENLIRQWLHGSVTDSEGRGLDRVCGITSVVWSTGTAAHGLSQLNSDGMYWIPSIPNYPNIDAAVVHNGTLHAFHYTVRDRHDFSTDAFEEFVRCVVSSIDGIARNVKMHYVSPTAPDLWRGPDNSNTFPIEAAPAPVRARLAMFQGGNIRSYTVSFHFHQLVLGTVGPNNVSRWWPNVADVDRACRECFTGCFSNWWV